MKRLALLTLLITAAPAYADVVESPPDECPEGSSPDTCHGGPHCVPNRCSTDTDCTEGFVCEEREYCVGTVNCAGMLGPGEDPRDYDRDVILGTCRDCSEACNFIRLCVPPLPSGGGGGGCSAGGSPGGFALLLLALGIVARRR